MGELSRNSGWGNLMLGAPTRWRVLCDGRGASCPLPVVVGDVTTLEFFSAKIVTLFFSVADLSLLSFSSGAEFVNLAEPPMLSGVPTRSDLRTLADWRKAAELSRAEVAVVTRLAEGNNRCEP